MKKYFYQRSKDVAMKLWKILNTLKSNEMMDITQLASTCITENVLPITDSNEQNYYGNIICLQNYRYQDELSFKSKQDNVI
jgi:hypothetical protein